MGKECEVGRKVLEGGEFQVLREVLGRKGSVRLGEEGEGREGEFQVLMEVLGRKGSVRLGEEGEGRGGEFQVLREVL